MAINNQTAVLKIVDNLVYFTVDVTPRHRLQRRGEPRGHQDDAATGPVGFVMNVTPQISENDIVVLNVRPTVTSQIGEVRDPNPELARVNQANLVPVIRSREFESVLAHPERQHRDPGWLDGGSVDGKRGACRCSRAYPFRRRRELPQRFTRSASS